MGLNLKYIGLGVLLIMNIGCSKKKVALDQQQFTALLIDIHMTDATLAQTRGYAADAEKKNYAYYNAIFQKYGIDQAEFDSCMHFYSSQSALFSKLYDVVIDSLNRRITDQNRILSDLRASDTINYFPRPDTVLIDTAMPVFLTEIDSLEPGLYKFNTTVRFDTIVKGQQDRIVSWFISADTKDTLRVKDIKMAADTLQRYYEWSQYVDSTYPRLIIKIADTDRPEKQKFRSAKAWGTQLLRPYTSPRVLERLKKSLPEGTATSFPDENSRNGKQVREQKMVTEKVIPKLQLIEQTERKGVK